jgi:hypothetical protein
MSKEFYSDTKTNDNESERESVHSLATGEVYVTSEFHAEQKPACTTDTMTTTNITHTSNNTTKKGGITG